MIKQHQFEVQYQKTWQRFETLIQQKNNKDSKEIMQNKGYEFIRLYRIICQHYALAKQRHYSPKLVQYLHNLVMSGHRLLYQRKPNVASKIFEFFSVTFPVRFRSHMGLFYLSLALALIPAILMGLACYLYSDMIYTLLPEYTVSNMESMYDPSNATIGREQRESATDLMMFAHYIKNNVGIDFQIYASGLFLGLGTMLSLVFNGLYFGGISGHLTNLGYGETFWSFVVGHASFELTAMIISGMAGLRLAQSLFMTGNYQRFESFKIAGRESIELLIGAATMTTIAAFIEAFWSSSGLIPNAVKYLVALLLWIMVIGYLALAGRESNYFQQLKLLKTKNHDNK